MNCFGNSFQTHKEIIADGDSPRFLVVGFLSLSSLIMRSFRSNLSRVSDRNSPRRIAVLGTEWFLPDEAFTGLVGLFVYRQPGLS